MRKNCIVLGMSSNVYGESLKFDRDAIPMGGEAAREYLRQGLTAEADYLEAHEPDPLAPLAERLAHALAAARLQAETEVLFDFSQELGIRKED